MVKFRFIDGFGLSGGTPDTSPVLIESGKPIEVTKITAFSIFGAGVITLFEADMSTVIGEIRVKTSSGAATSTFESTTNWVAHKGLAIGFGGTVTVTVWYNQPGS